MNTEEKGGKDVWNTEEMSSICVKEEEGERELIRKIFKHRLGEWEGWD